MITDAGAVDVCSHGVDDTGGLVTQSHDGLHARRQVAIDEVEI
jgi:hypothetical protein